MNNDKYDFILKPIVTRSGTVMACELLTCWRRSVPDEEDPSIASFENNFAKFPSGKIIKVFHKQIDVLTELYAHHFPLTVTLNADRILVHHLLHDKELQNRVAELPKLRLGLSEFFSARLNSEDILTLRCLSGITPLWLDDFGAGFTNMTLVSERLFEIIKIDKNFFWQYGNSVTFNRILTHLNELCK